MMIGGRAAIVAVVALLLVLGVGWLVVQPRKAIAPKVEAPPVLGAAPSFTLTKASGSPFSSDSLQGKLWVADFFFTSCAGPCPIMTTNMRRLQNTFEDEDRLHFVSISVDPETDTPERLAMYGEQYGANFARWHFLTGPIERIHETAQGFMIGTADDPNLHSTRFILVDGAGNIRGFYHGIEDESIEELQETLALLLQEETA